MQGPTDNNNNDTAASADGGGATRRNVLLGATTLAAATAVVSAIGGGVASAATAGQFTCDIPGVGQFAITSFQFGVGLGISSGGGGGRQTSAPSVSEVTVTKLMDSTSPSLFGAITRARVSDPVTITAIGTKGAPVITYVLGDVIVSGYSTSAGAELPFSESLSLNFTKITYSFDGVSVGYDLVTGKPT